MLFLFRIALSNLSNKYSVYLTVVSQTKSKYMSKVKVKYLHICTKYKICMFFSASWKENTRQQCNNSSVWERKQALRDTS